jgi:RHS repeat-associated protein
VSNTSAWIESGPVTIQAVHKNYHFGSQLVASRRGSEVYFIHGDHLGSTSLTTDNSGTVVAETRYLPYGEVRWTAGGAQPTDFTFTGQRAERGFGLMDYKARYYDPRLGRFISPDSIVPELGNPQSLNRYSYVNNSPVRFNDLSGHSRPLPPCHICQVKIDISNWSDLAKDLAVIGSFPTGFHVDREQNVITGPTEQKWLESSLTDMVNPIGMVSGPAKRVASELVEEGTQRLGQSVTREQVIESLGEAISSYLPRMREIAGENAQIGFRGSLAAGRVKNPKKLDFPGQIKPVDLGNFDIDFFIVSDELASRGTWGDQISELRPLQRDIRSTLGDLPEFKGLRSGREGFSIRIWTHDEAARYFDNEEVYFIGGR